jgi:hypothetical protein
MEVNISALRELVNRLGRWNERGMDEFVTRYDLFMAFKELLELLEDGPNE